MPKKKEIQPEDMTTATGIPKVKEREFSAVELPEGKEVSRANHAGRFIVNGTLSVGDGTGKLKRIYHVCPVDGPFNDTPNGWCDGEDLSE